MSRGTKRAERPPWQSVAKPQSGEPPITAVKAMALVALVDQSIILAARSAMKGNASFLEDLLGRLGGLDEGSTPEPRSGSRALDPSWDEVRTAYLLQVRDCAPGKPEWDDIISGKWLDEVYLVWGELMKACASYLQET